MKTEMSLLKNPTPAETEKLIQALDFVMTGDSIREKRRLLQNMMDCTFRMTIMETVDTDIDYTYSLFKTLDELFLLWENLSAERQRS